MGTEEKEEVVEIVTSWEQRGIEKGLREGLAKGRQEGRQEGQLEGQLEAWCTVLVDLLTTKFGPPGEAVIAGIQGIGSIEDLRTLTHRAITADSFGDLGL